MAMDISVSLFEKNVKSVNKKGFFRTYNTMASHLLEYVPGLPLGASPIFVLEATIDKGEVEEFQEVLKEYGFNVLGDTNYYHIGNLVNDYKLNQKRYPELKSQMDAIEKDYNNMKANCKPYAEIENDDAKFYFIPYNAEVRNLCDFVEKYKKLILEYCKKKDITLILNVIGYSKQVTGFFGFNFFDADITDREAAVDYASKLNVVVDFKDKMSVGSAIMMLSAITTNEEDLYLLNTHIQAENLRFKEPNELRNPMEFSNVEYAEEAPKAEAPKKAAPKKTTAKKSTKKTEEVVEAEAPKKAPAKKTATKKAATKTDEAPKAEAPKKAPAKKTTAKKAEAPKVEEPVVEEAPKKRGRPRKVVTE